MSTIEKSIDVHVPVRAVYNQWTQFEEFPRFMDGVRIVKQKDDKHLRWVANVSGTEEEWEAEISEQIPDKRVAWRSVDGAHNAGVVTFHYIDPNTTRVNLQMDYDPEGFSENVGDKLGFVTRRVMGDLERFKHFIEERGRATGGWRGEVVHPSDQEQPRGQVRPPGGRSDESTRSEQPMRSDAPAGARRADEPLREERGGASGQPPTRPEDPDR
jgi:uncharacterized membrane protein